MICLISLNTHANRGGMCLGGMCLGRNVPGEECAWGGMCQGRNVPGEECARGGMCREECAGEESAREESASYRFRQFLDLTLEKADLVF